MQVCIALVVTPEGLPLAYEVFDGNRADVTTVEEIVEHMRWKYGHERRTWVMDRGMVSEDNLQMLRGCGLGTAPRKLLEEMAEVRSLDVVLPTGAGPELRLRLVSRPENHLAILLQRLKLFLPNKAKSIKNVVEKIAPYQPVSSTKPPFFTS